MHVEYARPWVWASVAIMALDFAVRLCKLRLKTATVHTQEGGIVRVEFDDIKSGWRGGQHLWIRRLAAKSIFEGELVLLSSLSEGQYLRFSSFCVISPSFLHSQFCRVRSSSPISPQRGTRSRRSSII